MKGFLYKDFILNILNVVCTGIIVLGLSIYLLMNLKNGAQADAFTVYIALFTGIFSLNFSLPMFGLDCAFADARTKWSTYAMALPGGYKQMISSKYLLGILGHVLAIVCSFTMVLLCKLFAGFEMNLKAPVMCILFMTGLMLIFQSIFLPFVLKKRPGVVRVISIVRLVFAVYGLLCYAAFGDLSVLDGGDLESRIMLWFAIHESTLCVICVAVSGIGVVFEAASYLILKKTFLND